MSVLANNSNRENWLNFLDGLDWTRRECKQSAKLAIAKANWLGIPAEQAIPDILRRPVSGTLHAQPHLLFEIWQAVSDEVQLAIQPAGQWLVQP